MPAPSPVLGRSHTFRQRPSPATISGAKPVDDVKKLSRSQRLALLLSPVAPIDFHSDGQKIDALQTHWQTQEESDEVRLSHVKRNNDVTLAHDVEHSINWLQRATNDADIAASMQSGIEVGSNALRDFKNIRTDGPRVRKNRFYQRGTGLLDLPSDVMEHVARACVDAVFQTADARAARVLMCALRATCKTLRSEVDADATKRLTTAKKRLCAFVEGGDVDDEIKTLAVRGGLAQWSYKNFSCNAAILLHNTKWEFTPVSPPINIPVHLVHLLLRMDTEHGDATAVSAARAGCITPTAVVSGPRMASLWEKSSAA